MKKRASVANLVHNNNVDIAKCFIIVHKLMKAAVPPRMLNTEETTTHSSQQEL